MVFRYFLGNLFREAAQERLQEATTEAKEAAQRSIDLKCGLLVAMALPIESGGFVDSLNNVVVLAGEGFTERIGCLAASQTNKQPTVGVVETGVGQARAGGAIAEAIALRQPQWVISAGFAGGLHNDLHRGHFLMAESVMHAATGEELSVGLTLDKDALAASPGVHVGRLLTVDRLIRDPNEKRVLGQKHGALACDMETFAVAAACRQAKTRFLCVRIITDPVDEELPKEIAKLLDQKSTAAQLGAAAAALWYRPSAAMDLWKLKEEALQASDRLAKFLLGVMEQLPLEGTSD